VLNKKNQIEQNLLKLKPNLKKKLAYRACVYYFLNMCDFLLVGNNIVILLN